MPMNSTDASHDFASLMLKAASLCETLRVATRSVQRLEAPELFCVVKHAQPRIADSIRLISRLVGRAMDLPLSPSLDTEVIRHQELRDCMALEQFQASHGALSGELDQMAKHPALNDDSNAPTS